MDTRAGKVTRFEDLIAWQKSRDMVADIYRLTSSGEFARDYGLRDQVRRAAVSVLSNIVEGFDRGSRAEFHQFLVVAKGSCAEVRAQLYVALDVGYIDTQSFDAAQAKLNELARIVGGLRSAVSKQRKADPK